MSDESGVVQVRKSIVAWRAACVRERETGTRLITTENIETLLGLISDLLDAHEETTRAGQKILEEMRAGEGEFRASIESGVEAAVQHGYQLGVQQALTNPAAAALGMLVNEELQRRA